MVSRRYIDIVDQGNASASERGYHPVRVGAGRSRIGPSDDIDFKDVRLSARRSSASGCLQRGRVYGRVSKSVVDDDGASVIA